MDLVKWSADERVDIPDITAMSFLILSEFRRSMRLLAGDTLRKVVRGFKVEPSAAPDGRVRIRLDPTGTGERGKALGAENLTSGVDYGQLIGDRDSYFDDEGNAQQIIDLSAQPIATYTIEMRFVYTDGVNDNRAFWNEGTVSEYTSPVNTRRVAGWEAQYVTGTVGTGNEWIKLAEVVWDGGTIDAADITDKRDMLFEGEGPTFTQATQTGTGGAPDFTRTATRSDNPITDVVGAIRALHRQVQDIKGQSDDGTFDWFSRVFSAIDPTDSLGAQTKSLRTIDHVAYVVATGGEYGDYTGASGLHDLLTMIAANLASLPEHINIVLKSRTDSAQTLSGTYNLGDKRIRITGAFGGGTSDTTYGRHRIACTSAAASTVFTFTAGGGIELEGLSFTSPTNEVTMFSVAALGCRFAARNCEFFNVSSRTQVYADLVADSLDISGCTIGDLTSGGAGVWRIANSTLTTIATLPGRMAGTAFWFGRMLLYRGTPTAMTGRCFGLRFDSCSFVGALTAHAASAGVIVAAGAQHVAFDDCAMRNEGDEDCVVVLTGTDGVTEYASGQIAFRNCTFTSSSGSHAADAGTGGADGTGWALNIEGTSTTKVVGVSIDNCKFTGVSSIDSGAVRIDGADAVSITNPIIQGVTIPSTGRYTCFKALGTCSDIHITRALAEKFTATGTDLRGFEFTSCKGSSITHSTLRATDATGTAFTVTGYVGKLISCNTVNIESCLFEDWIDGTNDRGLIYETSNTYIKVRGNTFDEVSGRNCYLSSGTTSSNFIYDGNVFQDFGGATLACAIDHTIATSTNNGSTYVNNRLDTAAASKPFIRLGDDRAFVCTGNYGPNGATIVHTTPGSAPFAGAYGYNEGFKTNIATYA